MNNRQYAMEEISCVHLDNYIASSKNATTYYNIYSTFVKPSTRRACVTKALYCLCSVCNEHSPRLHACLYCIYFGCYDTGHIQDHAKNERHYLALDVNHGHVFCFECNDYVYSSVTFRLTEPLKQAWEEALSTNWLYRVWVPSWSELELFAAHPKRRALTINSTVGLRGLNNLGNTCFVNCIVQVLIHTPLLRNYFLSDLHDCSIGSSCIVCELAHIFQEFFSGDKSPLNVDKLIYIIWKEAEHMAGYKQQDSQEFFISALDLMHRHCEGQLSLGNTYHSKNCNCIVDTIFCGNLQSDVVCQACNNVSTTVESFWDMSLDLGHDTHSLVDCLERFTKAEHLDNITCSICNSYEKKSTKQLTLKTLPIVASFHLKRFEFSSGQKVSRQISFPAELDMSPFLSQNRNSATVNAPSQRYLYSLFAATEHGGTMNSGHYVAYVRRQKGVWLKCNDCHISRVSLTEVLASEAYQLFYHKQVLEYE